MRADDWPAVEAIFVEGIATRSATPSRSSSA